MTLDLALARLGRGYRRLWALTVEWCWERPRAALAGQSLMAWRSQRRQTREWMAEAHTAVQAAELDTVEGDIQVSQQRPAFNAEIERLLLVPKRTMEEERRLLWLQRTVRRIDELVATRGASPETLGPQRLAAFGPVGVRGLMGGASPIAGLLMSPAIWVAIAFTIPAAWGSVTSWRLNHAKADLRETRENLQQAIEERDGWRERADQYAQAVADAREAARQSAAALDDERRRSARFAAADRRRQREIQNVLVGSPEPPAWRLRDDDSVSGEPGAGD
jgi:hypothetical protein